MKFLNWSNIDFQQTACSLYFRQQEAHLQCIWVQTIPNFCAIHLNVPVFEEKVWKACEPFFCNAPAKPFLHTVNQHILACLYLVNYSFSLIFVTANFSCGQIFLLPKFLLVYIRSSYPFYRAGKKTNEFQSYIDITPFFALSVTLTDIYGISKGLCLH